MRNLPKFLLATSGMFCVATGLGAQELHYGLQATLAYPLNDLGKKELLDDSLGYGLGAHMQIAFHGGHAIMPRIDYTYFDKSSPTRKVQMLQVGADYNYFFSRQVNQGLYVGAGAGFGMAKFEVPGDDDTPNTAYGAASAGYMFTPHMGAEVRYTWAKYKPELLGSKPEFTSPTVGASFIYRF